MILVKNWPDDPRVGCDVLATCLEDFGDAEAEFMEELEEEFEDDIGRLVEECEEEIEIES